jgi:hypothetical protein
MDIDECEAIPGGKKALKRYTKVPFEKLLEKNISYKFFLFVHVLHIPADVLGLNFCDCMLPVWPWDILLTETGF